MPDELDNPSAQFLERKLATILSADVASFSRLMGEDEEQTLRTFRGHKQVFESLVAMHRGRIFNTAGDAILAEFASAVEAVRCATDIQSALRTRNDQLPPSRQVKFRIGINLGDVLLQGQDLLGDGVNVAARLQTAAEPGGICISGSVHDQISNKLSLTFQPLGDMNFKNIQQPVRTFSIAEAEGAGALPVHKPDGIHGGSRKWMVVAGVLLLLLLIAGGFWAYAVKGRGQPETVRAIAPAPQPPATTPAAAPPARDPEPRRPSGAAVASAPAGGRFDGVYSGPICYGQTKKLPERCFHAEGTISGAKISSRWAMGTDKKLNMVLAGDVARNGDVMIEIQMFSADDGSRQATINLSGTLREGLLNTTGNFLKGRAATLNWHKETAHPK